MGGFLIFYDSKTVPPPAPAQDNSDTSQKWESRIDDQANVTVTATPADLGVDAEEWKFDVVMETHSVELDQDMIETTTLVDNPGREYKPLRWEGTEPGGHHREGTLIFAPIKPYPQHLNLFIKNIGGKNRAFAWILNGE